MQSFAFCSEPSCPSSNPRHEIFAKARAKGVRLEDAYELAGFAPVRGHASRLARRADVATRIAELRVAISGWEETTGQAIVGALLRMADSRDFFDSPQRMRETRLTLMEARNLQKELTEEREAERGAVRKAANPRRLTVKTCQKAAKSCQKPAKTCQPLALPNAGTRAIASEN